MKKISSVMDTNNDHEVRGRIAFFIFLGFIISFIIVTLMACRESNVHSTQTEWDLGYVTPLQVIVIDNCEYLYGDWGYMTVLTHKGDCSNDDHDYIEIRE